MVSEDQPDAREGQTGRGGVAERLVVPMKPGKPDEERSLVQVEREVVKDGRLGDL